METFYKIDWKGQAFILQDIVYQYDVQVGKISLGEITDEWLFAYLEDCTYYGLPPYHGKSEELNRRIEDAYETLYGVRPN